MRWSDWTGDRERKQGSTPDRCMQGRAAKANEEELELPVADLAQVEVLRQQVGAAHVRRQR